MNLQNGYKVLYEVAASGKRTFYASKLGVFADAEVIAEAETGKYKLIYEKNGQIYGSTTNIPTDSDYCFEDFDKVFKKTSEEPVAPAVEEPATYGRRTRKATPAVEETSTEEPVVEETPVVEE
jgi:hypothetical protein